MKNQKIDLGEYVVTILYDDVTGNLIVNVLDEEHEIIESIHVTTDEDGDEEDTNTESLNLN